MIDFKNIHSILCANKMYGYSENIDIAKGLYSIPKSWGETFSHILRQWQRKR